MIIVNRENFKLEIVNTVLDLVEYQELEDIFKSTNYYKAGDFVVPYFRDGITFTATGEAGVNYRVEIGDLAFEFEESDTLFLPGNTIESRVIDAAAYKEGGIFLGSAGIAFVFYMTFTYVIMKVLEEKFEEAREIKISRYLLDNLEFSEGFDTVWGKLYSVDRFDTWTFEEYRDLMVQVVSAFKSPTVKSFRELVSAVGYKVFGEDKKRLYRWGLGHGRIDNSKWEIELV